MKKISLFVICCIGILLFQHCSTDFDLNAEYKDITIVYGLLNRNDSTHYIKINKAFLSEGDALIMAQDPASNMYNYDEIEVKVEQWSIGAPAPASVFYLDTVLIHNKESGVFYYPDQIVYRFDKYRLDDESIYRIIVTNKITGKEVTSETGLIKNFKIDKPSSGQNFIGFTALSTKYVEWKSAENGRLYEVNVLFNYFEKDLNTGEIDSNKYIKWYLGSKRSSSTDGGENMEVAYIPDNFFSNIRAKVPINPDKSRVAGKVTFIVSVASDEYAIYMDVNGPSNSIVQERPEYTNISNGIGLFASRYDNSIDRPRSFHLELRSLDSLVVGSHTKDHGFLYTF